MLLILFRFFFERCPVSNLSSIFLSGISHNAATSKYKAEAIYSLTKANPIPATYNKIVRLIFLSFPTANVSEEVSLCNTKRLFINMAYAMVTINKIIPYKITVHNKKLFSPIQPEEKGNKVIQNKKCKLAHNTLPSINSTT